MYSKVQSLALLATALSTLVEASPTIAQITRNPTDVLRRSLMKRDNVGVACGLWSTGKAYDIGSGLGEDADEVTVAANSCGRIGCYDTSGVYVCNDQDVEITIPMDEAIAQVDYLNLLCRGGENTVSGQVFSDSYGGYNLNIGYCNNNHPLDARPSDYTFPGPNGNPPVTCGGFSGSACSGAACIEGTITMDEQTSVECGEYLAPSYIGPGATYTYTTTRNIGTTWTTGGFLSIDTSDLWPVSVQAGFFSSFAETTTTGDTSGLTSDCGNSTEGSFTCGMHVVPRCWQMSGTRETEDLGTVPWASIQPRLTAQDGQSVYTAEICTCQNCPGADEAGAPDDDCGLDCDACNE